MKSAFSTMIILGIASLVSGLIRFAIRRTIDPDIIVGAVFFVPGIIMRLARK